jgi:hypothetical protein
MLMRRNPALVLCSWVTGALLLGLVAGASSLGTSSAAPIAQPAPAGTVADVREYGLLADGTDQSASLQKILDRRGVISFPEGTFIAGGLVVRGDTTIVGVPGKTVIKQPKGVMYVLSVNPGRGGTSDPADNEKAIQFKGVTLEGRVVEDGFSEHDSILNLNAVTDVLIENCIFRGFRGDGIYLGSSNIANVERHNQNVIIRNCVFDGVTKNNRHGVFVVDGTNIRVENNLFVDSTRFGDQMYVAGSKFDNLDPNSGPGMPGPFNIEPDGWNFTIVRDIVVDGNTFCNCNARSGTLQLYLPLKNFNTAPSKFIFSNNHVVEGNRSATGINLFSNGNATTDTPNMNITISGNVIENTWSGLSVMGTKGTTIVNNRFENTGSSPIIGYLGNTKNVDLMIEGNTFRNISTETNGGLAVFSNDRLTIRNNKFIDAYGHVITFQSGASTSFVTLEGNEVFAPAGKTAYGFRGAGHQFSPETNLASGNIFHDGVAGDDFPAANRTMGNSPLAPAR